MTWNTSPEPSRREMAYLLAGGVVSSLLDPTSRTLATTEPDGLVRARPEDEGVDPRAISAFLEEVTAAKLELHSFMLSRNGKVISEGWWWPYGPQRRHMMHSLTKSVTACAVGIALDEGRFSLSDKVVSFFPEHLPPVVSENLAAMTVRDLLTMRTGHSVETSGSVWRPLKSSWVAEFYKIPVTYRPGAKFVYTSAATYMLSAIVTKTTGMRVRDYLQPRLFEPLSLKDVRWDLGPENINPGANGISLRTADILKLGMLHAQGGRWAGRQILPAAWVAAATRREDGDEDYGFQWWIGPDDAYYALGLFTQMSIVFPHHDAVLALTGAIDGSEHIRPLVWKYFPTAFTAAPMTRQDAPWRDLKSTVKNLRLLPALKPTRSPLVAALSGRTFKVAPNEDAVTELTFRFDDRQCVFTQVDARGEHSVKNGLGDWIEGLTTMTGAKLHHEYEPEDMPVVAGAEWIAPDTLRMTWQFVESAFRDTVICRFNGDGLTLDRSVNVNSAALSRPRLKAKLLGT